MKSGWLMTCIVAWGPHGIYPLNMTHTFTDDSQVHRQSIEHFPDQEGWGHLMQPLHDALATSAICTDRLPQLNQVSFAVNLNHLNPKRVAESLSCMRSSADHTEASLMSLGSA